MRQLFFAAGLLLSILISGCKPDKPEVKPEEKGKIRLKVNVTSGTQPLVMNQEYQTATGLKYNVELLKFYLSNITLVKEDDGKILAKDVVLVDLSEELKQPYDANAIGTQFTFEVPAGNYKSVEMNLGVPKDKNVVSNDYANEHPLSIYRGTDWSWAGYRFIMIQGNARDGNNQFKPYEYHIAGDTFLQAAQYNKSFNVAASQTTEIPVNVNIDKVFFAEVEADRINPVQENITHSEGAGSQIRLAWKVTRNFLKSISL